MEGNDKFNIPENHGSAFALLYDSRKIENKFKDRTELRYVIIKDKEEKRISSMVESAGDIGASFVDLQKAAICCVAIASTQEEALLMQIGLVKSQIGGVAICPACLAKAILTCEENLAVLKDIQEATKVYAK